MLWQRYRWRLQPLHWEVLDFAFCIGLMLWTTGLPPPFHY